MVSQVVMQKDNYKNYRNYEASTYGLAVVHVLPILGLKLYSKDANSALILNTPLDPDIHMNIWVTK